MTDDGFAALGRAAYYLYEPVHAVVYFDPAIPEAFAGAGLTGFWRSYFAARSAPLGRVTAGPVAALFHGFALPMVERALPDVWTRIAPEHALHTRRVACSAVLQRLFAGIDDVVIKESAALLRDAAGAGAMEARPLGAANALLPMPDDPIAALWQAATTLRELRGDGHVLALTHAELDGVEAHALRDAIDGSRARLQPARGWTDEDWDGAVERLRARGLVDSDGRATADGRALRERVEADTDRLAAGPWRALGEDRTRRLLALLPPLADAALTVVPTQGPIGDLTRPT
ncbi:MAG TPA: hypothetical protein VHE83_12680 [Mycobacteriales bacterium]|nr:hypothetical protein [Mycobacteriales bacterium]